MNFRMVDSLWNEENSDDDYSYDDPLESEVDCPICGGHAVTIEDDKCGLFNISFDTYSVVL